MTTQDVEPSLAKQKRLVRKAIRLVGSQSRLAESVGCSQMMVWKLLHGRARISVEMARKVHQATDGKCHEADMRPDFFIREAGQRSAANA